MQWFPRNNVKWASQAFLPLRLGLISKFDYWFWVKENGKSLFCKKYSDLITSYLCIKYDVDIYITRFSFFQFFQGALQSSVGVPENIINEKIEYISWHYNMHIQYLGYFPGLSFQGANERGARLTYPFS